MSATADAASLESGKPVQVLVAMGTVPHVVTTKGLAAYAKDAFHLDLSHASVCEVCIDGGATQTSVVVPQGFACVLPMSMSSSASGAVPLDSLKAVADLCRHCHEQAKRIRLLEDASADYRRSMGEDGPRTALIAERGRNLLLSAELEDVKQRLRESEATVQEFASVIAQLKADVRKLVEVHSLSDFHGSV